MSPAPAPYWGELPSEAKATGAHNHRRSVSEQVRRPPDEEFGGSAKRAVDRPNHPNRISVQSTNTDAPTESTLSPFATPTNSNFTPGGLAPRPASDRRSRRQPPLNVEDYEAVLTPPPAPDPPRAPPISYRSPLLNEAPLFPGGPSRPPRQAPTSPNMDQQRPDDVDTLRRWASPGRTDTRVVAPMQTRRDVYGGAEPSHGESAPSLKSQNPPTSTESRQFAEGRSPLQKLEKQLVVLTKEEKRARMVKAEEKAREKAEDRAREKAERDEVATAAEKPEKTEKPDKSVHQVVSATAAASPEAEILSHQQQVRFRDRWLMTNGTPPQDVEAAARPQTAIAAAVAPGSRAPPVQMPETKPMKPIVSGPNPRQAQPQRAIQRQIDDPDPGDLTRNLSFRDRAATSRRKDLSAAKGNGGGEDGDGDGDGGVVVSPPMQRRTSNKLKKEPPSDSRYRDQAEASRPVTRAQAPQTSAPLNGERDGAASGSRVPLSAVAAATAAAALTPAGTADDMREFRRRASEPMQHRSHNNTNSLSVPSGDAEGERELSARPSAREGSTSAIVGRPRRLFDEESSDVGQPETRTSKLMFDPTVRGPKVPGDGLYKPPRYLDEWKKGCVANLTGPLLDLSDDGTGGTGGSLEKEKAWWDHSPSGGRRGISSRPRKAEAFDGEYDETSGVPTRFKPPLYLECGPLLRYCGIRHERSPSRTAKKGVVSERSIWRGTVMIVTRDRASSYDIAPTLRLFLQPLELLPPPPAEIIGEEDLPPEYVDPIAGLPKLGRKGETLYVRPVEDLPEATDLSKDETLNGLFEPTRTAPDHPPAKGSSEPPGSFASRRKRVTVDGESASKYKDVKGFRLHTERGATFWRFNIEVELGAKQQRIAYRINRGPSTGFWVPARGESMNIMFSSCNSFSRNVDADDFCGPDPMWRDVLNTHQTRPFHVMIGGGEQIYNDMVMDDCDLFRDWMDIRDNRERLSAPFTREMQAELEAFYLQHYCTWFSQGLFGLANSQIPMVNMFDDHDIFDGYGSYPHPEMSSAVMCGLGAVAFKYYMLFQHQSTPEETESNEPSWILGVGPGPYINERSRSLLMALGHGTSLLAVDCRTERSENDVVSDRTWEKIMNRCHDELVRGETHHLLVLLGIPVAYPRLVWLENLLTSRLMNPIKALGRTGIFGSALNKLDGGAEVLDDINDHWTAKHHKGEREVVIQDLQDLAGAKLTRITILSGDVQLAAVGQFYSNPKLRLPKHADRRYIPNVISSAIANAPPPDILADIINKRDKIHHLDAATDEDMIPMFPHGVDSNPRNNTHLLPHRNWCSIRPWMPGSTPPSTPPASIHERSPSPPAGLGGILRRFSSRRKPAPPRSTTVLGPRPPPASGGFFRSLSRSRRNSQEPTHSWQQQQQQQQQSSKPSRSLSLTRAGSVFGRRDQQPDDGGINGQWGESDDDKRPDARPLANGKGRGPSVIQRGRENREYDSGDEAAFTTRALHRPRTQDDHRTGMSGVTSGPMPPGPRPFHRTATQVLERERDGRAAGRGILTTDVNLEGGLDICINAEVSRTDPAGITVPYRLLVPRLFYDGEEKRAQANGGGAGRQGPVAAVAVGADTASSPAGMAGMDVDMDMDIDMDMDMGMDVDVPMRSRPSQMQSRQSQMKPQIQPQPQPQTPAAKPPSRLFGSLRKRQATF